MCRLNSKSPTPAYTVARNFWFGKVGPTPILNLPKKRTFNFENGRNIPFTFAVVLEILWGKLQLPRECFTLFPAFFHSRQIISLWLPNVWSTNCCFATHHRSGTMEHSRIMRAYSLPTFMYEGHKFEQARFITNDLSDEILVKLAPSEERLMLKIIRYLFSNISAGLFWKWRPAHTQYKLRKFR